MPFAKVGFAWGLRHGFRSLAIAAAAGFAFGLWMVAADRWLFAAIVPAAQHALFHLSAWPTILFLILRDEVVLRGVILPLLLWTIFARRRNGPLVAVLLTALVAWPLLNLAYVGSINWSGIVAARELGLHFAATALWGWLCWRHGWLAGLAAHLAAYAALIPLS